jgi:hypothetical protein
MTQNETSMAWQSELSAGNARSRESSNSESARKSGNKDVNARGRE